MKPVVRCASWRPPLLRPELVLHVDFGKVAEINNAMFKRQFVYMAMPQIQNLVQQKLDAALKQHFGDVLPKLQQDRQMAEAAPDYVSSDCPIAARQILQGMGDEAKNVEKAHPLTLIRRAYGI